MSSGPTEPLLAELARGLRAVRPIPRERTVVLGALALWAGSVALQGALGGPLPMLPEGTGVAPTYVAVLTGLSITAFAALLAALAGVVPGREALARTTRILALAGVLLALAGGAWAVAAAGDRPSPSGLLRCLECMGRSCALGILPALLVGISLGRASGRRPGIAAALGALGAVTLGAVAVHTSCAVTSASHLLVGHSLAPLAAALLLSLPLALLVRSVARHAEA